MGLDEYDLSLLEEEAKAQLPSTNASKILILISALREANRENQENRAILDAGLECALTCETKQEIKDFYDEVIEGIFKKLLDKIRSDA